MLGLFLFCKQRFNQNFPRKQTRREKYLFMWGTDLGSLGDLVAEDLALYVAEVCVQRYRLQNQKERKKKVNLWTEGVRWNYTKRKTYHFIAYRASFLACFVSLVRISEAFETSSFTNLDDFLYFGLKKRNLLEC